MGINNKPVILREPRAIRLVRDRAIREDRSNSNALAKTVLEALENQDSPSGLTMQGKIKTKSVPGDPAGD